MVYFELTLFTRSLDLVLITCCSVCCHGQTQGGDGKLFDQDHFKRLQGCLASWRPRMIKLSVVLTSSESNEWIVMQSWQLLGKLLSSHHVALIFRGITETTETTESRSGSHINTTSYSIPVSKQRVIFIYAWPPTYPLPSTLLTGLNEGNKRRVYVMWSNSES